MKNLIKGRRKYIRWIFIFVFVTSIAILPGTKMPTQIAHATPADNCHNYTDVDEHYYMCDGLNTLSGIYSPQTGQYAINGYSDHVTCGIDIPCFRPYDNVTRGQYCKIIAITMGWTYSGNAQDFTDVPTSSPFYIYIEATYNRITSLGERVISGYTNPDSCPTGTPCFLPGNGITRGQMAKISSNARNYTEDMGSRQPTSADVPSGSTFFNYIERLTLHVSNAPYPPNLAQPPCPSTSPQKPCSYPAGNTTRADAAEFAYRAYQGPDGYGQVFPHKYGGIYGGPAGSAGWDAISAYVTTPDPGIIGGGYSFWIGAPIALTNYYSRHFVESGPTKDCLDPNNSSSCRHYPYASWSAGGSTTETDLTSQELSHMNGAGYTFRTDPDGFGIFKPQWCDGNGCYGILTSPNYDTGNLGVPSLSFWVAGGESNTLDQHWGNIYIYNVHEHHYGGDWTTGSESCYDPIIVPINTGYGTISPNCTDGTWNVNY